MSFFRLFLAPFSALFFIFIRLRSWLFRIGLLKSKRLPSVVISVGNISVGGTGKTPLLIHLAEWLQSQNKFFGIISRGYKSAKKNPRKVDLSEKNLAYLYGDEPALLAQRFQKNPVYVGAQRFAVGALLLSENKVDFILADDAFQHRQLYRDLDIVVLDCMNPPHLDSLLPKGRLREGLRALSRADFIVLSRTNLVSKNDVSNIYESLGQIHISKEKIIEAKVVLHGLHTLNGSEKVEISKVKDTSKVFLVSGIGEPQAFEQMMRNEGFIIQEHFCFSDHYQYTAADVQRLFVTAAKNKIKKIFITEKDAVKWIEILKAQPHLLSPGVEVYSVRITTEFNENIKGLYDEIISLAR